MDESELRKDIDDLLKAMKELFIIFEKRLEKYKNGT